MYPLAAISFIAPAMLFGTALAALPIAAHLLSRRTRRRIVFPTIQLLSESSASTSRIYRLRRLLVLLLRCLAVFLIVLAFAQPIWSDRGTVLPKQGRGVAAVILIDNSVSTTQREGGVSLTNSIRALAERTLNSLQNGTDRVGIIYASARPRSALPELTNNLELLRQDLRRFVPTQERADFPQALALAAEMLKEHRGQRRLVVISDMQRSNWSEVTLKGATESTLPQGTILTVLAAGTAQAENVSLSAPKAVPVQPILNQPTSLIVHLSNYSPETRTIRVSASVNGNPLDAKEVKLAAWDGAEVSFEMIPDSLGRHRIVFSTEPDVFSPDNLAFLTINAVRRVPVVVVGDDNPDQPGSGTYFLIRSLAPRGDMGDDIEVRHLTGADLSYSRISDAEAVFVSYVGKLTTSALDALYVYANQGGGVAWFCGEGPVQQNLLAFNAVAKRTEILPWPPVQFRDLSSQGQFLQIADGLWDSGPLTEFSQQGQTALKQIRFQRVWSAGRPTKGSLTLLKYDDRTPAMSGLAVGKGKIVLCNFSPSLTCSDLGKYGAYVALMQGLFDYLRPLHQQQHGAFAGESLVYAVRARSGFSAGPLTVLGPDERPCPCEITGDNIQTLLRISRAKLPGFYRILQQTPSGENALLAQVPVNIDPREGDLRRVDYRVLIEQLAGKDVVLEVRGQDQAGPVLRVRGTSLWPWLLVAAMVTVGLELILLCLWKQ